MGEQDSIDDAIVERFEQAWQDREYDLARQVMSDPSIGLATLVELIMIDMEYRWRGLGDGNPILLEDYGRQHPELADSRQMLALIAEEFRVRSRFGDSPTLQSYLDCYPNCEGLHQKLLQVESQLPAAFVHVHSKFSAPYSMRLPSKLIVGRQDLKQPAPPCQISVNGRQKLIVAPLNMLHVSREQLEIDFDGERTIQIKNLSKEILVRIGKDQPQLESGGSRSLELPAQVGFYNVDLHIVRT